MATATKDAPATEARTIADLLTQLGDVPADRVRLVPTPGTATEKDVIAVWDRSKRLCELVEGTLVEKTVGAPEALLASLLGHFLWMYLDRSDLGFCMGADGKTRISPGLVRIPDLSFVSRDRVPNRMVPDEPILGLAPDLAVEVISPGNSKGEMARKLQEYFDAGVRLVWYVYPRPRTVHVFTAPGRPRIVREGQSLDGGAVLPGFVLPLAELFERAARGG